MLEILKTKLQAIDSECEATVRSEIETFYQSAKYDGNRFVVPSFNQVGAVWLKHIGVKEKLLKEELHKVMSHPNFEIGSKEITELNNLISEIFDDSRYLNRLRGFSEGLGRKASSYGIKFEPSELRLELYESSYEVGVKNTLQKARRTLTAEVTLHSLPRIPKSVKNIKGWLSFIKARPWQSLIFVLVLVVFALLSSVGLQDILGWLNSSLRR